LSALKKARENGFEMRSLKKARENGFEMHSLEKARENMLQYVTTLGHHQLSK
jgi:hypothetical protein